MPKAAARCLLGNIKPGQRMTITVIAACGSAGKIILCDDKKVYATLEKKTVAHQYMLLGSEGAKYEGGANLRVEFDLEHPSYSISLKPIITENNVVDKEGKIVGSSTVIAVEDYNDYDYNDVVVNILATNK